jgi:hypothetical protein
MIKLTKAPLTPVQPTDPHPFVGSKIKPCERCGGGFYASEGHWRRP